MEILRFVGRGAVGDGIALGTLVWRSVRARLSGSDDSDERGQGLAEYALILALIAVVAIAALAFFGQQLSDVLTDPVGEQLSSVRALID